MADNNFRAFGKEEKTKHNILRRQSHWVNLGELVGFIHNYRGPQADLGIGNSFNIRQTPNEDHNIPVYMAPKLSLQHKYRENSSLAKIRARIMQNPLIEEYPSIVLKCIEPARDPMLKEVPQARAYMNKGDALKGLRVLSIEEEQLAKLSSNKQNEMRDEFRNVFEVSGIVVSVAVNRDENRIDFTILNGRMDMIPCVAFGKDAHNLYSSIVPKTVVLLSGRVINTKLKINAKEAVIQTVLQVNKAMPPKFGFDCPKADSFPAPLIEFFERYDKVGTAGFALEDLKGHNELRSLLDGQDDTLVDAVQDIPDGN